MMGGHARAALLLVDVDADAGDLVALTSRYQDVVALGDPATSIAATARIGQAYARSTDAQQAREAFEVCLELSAKLDWFDDSSRLCERELARIDRVAYPARSEALGAPATTTFTVLAPALTRLAESPGD